MRIYIRDVRVQRDGHVRAKQLEGSHLQGKGQGFKQKPLTWSVALYHGRPGKYRRVLNCLSLQQQSNWFSRERQGKKKGRGGEAGRKVRKGGREERSGQEVNDNLRMQLSQENNRISLSCNFQISCDSGYPTGKGILENRVSTFSSAYRRDFRRYYIESKLKTDMKYRYWSESISQILASYYFCSCFFISTVLFLLYLRLL